ncbi:uncharacterized protein KY384_002582 [Bacidia gigantensis]|uniref:uncharacterized protein n=1 Tax=Bacidia gigantensis TaxID=2732470 RepID=UPI001D0374EC|nr:uncharacterized protein KY384_002582 [Bacidia gigantensis]KAG8532705.1 hypothetical protein KY384_002582 [Bacidia gigantensis]
MPGSVSEPVEVNDQVKDPDQDGVAGYVWWQGKDKAMRQSADTGEAVTRGFEMETDISASQKMLSAVSGSLLTSLLVTPLDVVRVRLQSQFPTSKPDLTPSAQLNKLPSFSKLPPNLGVTACCREVFWVNNTSSFCLANASPSVTYTAVNPAISTSSAVAADCAVDEARQKTYSSTLDGLRKIARNEGLTSLWRGLSPTLVMAIPANVIYFTGYDALRFNKSSPIRKYVSNNYAPFVAGSVARVAAAATISPIEMFRTRMQAASAGNGTGVFMETLSGLKKLVQTQGVTSLWRGLTLTMWRDVPFSGVYWWGYEFVREALIDLRDPHERFRNRPRDHAHASTFVDSFVAGATSGAVASVITTPFDVGKTRQQVLETSETQARSASGGAALKGLRPEERSMPRFLLHIWNEEGMRGLFKGWAARTLKVAPACAIMISSYEIGKKMARSMNERGEMDESVG